MLCQQDTQTDLHNKTMEQEFVRIQQPSRSAFCPENAKPKSIKEIKKDEEKEQPLTVVLGDSTNVVRIKPKNRTLSGVNGGQNNENSVQPMQSSQKAEQSPLIESTKNKKPKDKTKTNFFQQASTCKVALKPVDFLLKPVEGPLSFTILRETRFLQNDVTIKLQGLQSKVIVYENQFKLMGHRILIKLPQKNLFDELCEKMDRSSIGWLQSNYDGSVFTLSEINQLTNQSVNIATFQYLPAVDKFGGPRNVKAFIKEKTITGGDQNGQATKNTDIVLQMQKTMYDSSNQTYGLNFNTKKSIHSSVHNMILVNGQKKPMLKLFKYEQKEFELQVLPPMTPLIGCAFAMSSFLFKLASQ